MEYSVIAGLGNPGDRYARTRHNIGARVVQSIAERLNVRSFKSFRDWRLSVAEGDIGGERLYLLLPETYMNTSGEAIAPFLSYHKILSSQLLVIHDEIDLGFGTIRLKHGGGHAGHNGLRSIVKMVGTPEFGRVRVGVGRPLDGREVADWVLASFSAEEEGLLPGIIDRGANAAILACREGLKRAQSSFH